MTTTNPSIRECGDCNGNKVVYIIPWTVSPPSLHRGDYGGYEPNSNIKSKICVTCPACNGEGYRNVQLEISNR